MIQPHSITGRRSITTSQPSQDANRATNTATRANEHFKHGKEDINIAHQSKVSISPRSHIRALVLRIAYPMGNIGVDIPSSTTFGVWYLTPEYHFTESVAMAIIGGALLIASLAYTLTTDTFAPDTPLPIHPSTLLSTLFKVALTLDYMLHISYKINNPPHGRGLWWLLQPCSVNHATILLFLCCPQWLTPRIVLYLVAFTCGTCNALAFPDTTNNIQFLSTQHFWFQHICILLVPFYWLLSHSVLMDQMLSVWIAIGAHGLNMLYHFIPLELAAIVSGVNLNYLMSPPDTIILTRHGANYRIVMTVAMLGGHVLCGYVVPHILLPLCL